MCPINTIDDNLTLNSAVNTIEQNDHMSFLVYPEEDEVTYMISVPKEELLETLASHLSQ